MDSCLSDHPETRLVSRSWFGLGALYIGYRGDSFDRSVCVCPSEKPQRGFCRSRCGCGSCFARAYHSWERGGGVPQLSGVTRIDFFVLALPAALSATFSLDDGYGFVLDEDQEFYAEDCGATASGRWKEIRSTSGRYCHLLIEKNDPEVSISLNGLLGWLTAGVRTYGLLFASSSRDIPTPGINKF